MALDAGSPLDVPVSASLVFAVVFFWFTISCVFKDFTARDVLDLDSTKALFDLSLSLFAYLHHITTTFCILVYTVLTLFHPCDVFLELYHYAPRYLRSYPFERYTDAYISFAGIKLCHEGQTRLAQPFSLDTVRSGSIETNSDLAIQFAVSTINSVLLLVDSDVKEL